MEIRFVVHNISTVPHRAQVEMKGESIFASVDCVEVELVGADLHGSFTARFYGADAGEARAKFKKDAIVVWPI